MIEGQVAEVAQDSAVGMDGAGRFVVGFLAPAGGGDNDVFLHRFDAEGICVLETGDEGPALLTDESENSSVGRPSVAMNAGGYFGVSWLANRNPLLDDSRIFKRDLGSTYSFDADPFQPGDVGVPGGTGPGPDAKFPSLSVGANNTYSVVWGRKVVEPEGLVYALDIDGPAGIQIRSNDEGDRFAWQPCVSVRDDGYFVIAFSDQVPPDFVDSNILVQLYDSSGDFVAEAYANQTVSMFETAELSPALAFVDNDVVVTWIGQRPDGCTDGGSTRIYARKTTWAGTGPLVFTGSAPQFILNDAQAWNVEQDPNPTVSLNPLGTGEFVIAWNAENSSDGISDVRAQFFNADALPIGSEVGVTQLADSDPPTEVYGRRLAESAQHSVAYRSDGSVVATWTRTEGGQDPVVYFTILPTDYAELNGDPCCKGDVNGDRLRNGLDIQPFVDLLLDPESQVCFSIVELCPPDLNSDGVIDVLDIPPFVSTILAGEPCDQTLQPRGMEDCNENGIADANDIADCDDDPACEDCNGNFIPDGCDIEAETSADLNENSVPDECEPDCNGNDVPDDADINGYSTGGTPVPPGSEDVNENGIPDECEPDCNRNDVPDDADIDGYSTGGTPVPPTSDDVNENGIPDECEPDCNANDVPDDADINGYSTGETPVPPTSADCNANGWPDECESDCNGNGVPDDCDVNGSFTGETPVPPVSEDCNGNGLPDECDFELPILPSLDCNENGIPDECDINGYFTGGTPVPPVSEDCNENGFPDECDVMDVSPAGTPVPPISEDENVNEIPDECEQEQMQGGGGAAMQSAYGGEASEAWAEFYEWCAEQTWGPGAEIGPAAQFQRLVDKLAELELPLGNPWVVAAPATASEE